jgi:RimJ/RimL family protein N-acetyltransferase
VPVRTPADPVTVANVSSHRVAERCGYVRDGVMRLVHLKDDRRIDAALWSWLPSGPA